MALKEKIMIRGDWDQIKQSLKSKFGNLTDEDLAYQEGQEEELLGRLQQRLGKTKEEVQYEIVKASDRL